MKKVKILFILKERFYNNVNVKSYGLINSSKHIADYLDFIGCETKVVTVIDGNGIDKEVYNYKPDVVIIEALWVTAEKMRELIDIKRYKNIKWVVRIHSDAGYLSAETMALKYINDYINLNKHNLFVAPNNEKFCEYLSNALKHKLLYLPNVIMVKSPHVKNCDNSDIINIGCFGALRILKNQFFQALCAIKAADELHKTLHFHINVDPKTKDEIPNPVLKNLEELFANSNHKLIKHQWSENEEFQELVRKMDLGLQLSYTESFNIVATDFINNDRLLLASEAIGWMPDVLKTSTVDYDEVTEKIIYLYNHRNSYCLKRKMRKALINYNVDAEKIWLRFIKHL